MPRLMADHNVEGHLKSIIDFLNTDEWYGHWEKAEVTVLQMAAEGLDPDSSDLLIWQTCQGRQIVLFTGNRNRKESDSLEEAIQTLNQLESLPVITLGDPNCFTIDRSYAEQAAIKLLEYLLDHEKFRGTGRLYIP